ncbi:hypothetical protein LTR53_008761 [Teratosphaeriaceae sp. CCFEE 6253]|nr:hypothetical protein LTR53_008761 [Teratosphaeriaceae sp. CCFEE 6253]
MASLNDSLKSFNSDRAEAAKRNLKHSRPATTTPTPRTSTPKPRSTPTPAASNAPSTSSTAPAGVEILSHVLHAVTRLSDVKTSTWPALLAYLSLPHHMRNPLGEANMKRAICTHHRIAYTPAPESEAGKEMFAYAPLHPVTSGDELCGYLARLATEGAGGVSVKELRDGWPECVSTIERLEKEGQVLVSRSKKDAAPLRVYSDNPSYHLLQPSTSNHSNPAEYPAILPIDPDFLHHWSTIRLPASDAELRKELLDAGLTPTSSVRDGAGMKAQQKKGSRKGIVRKNAKRTNTHLSGILKDYSKVKAAGGLGRCGSEWVRKQLWV